MTENVKDKCEPLYPIGSIIYNLTIKYSIYMGPVEIGNPHYYMHSFYSFHDKEIYEIRTYYNTEITMYPKLKESYRLIA